jgi:hypothetical protein
VPRVHFLFTDFAATFRVEEPFWLPFPHYSGSMLRGILGWALGEVACEWKSEGGCASACGSPRSCTYGMLYEDPPSPPGVENTRTGRNPPKRMILLVPELGRGGFARADFFTCGLRVLGRLGEGDVSQIKRAFDRMGELDFGTSRGRVRLERFRRVGPMNQRPCTPRFDPPPRFATLTFVTPAWIERTEERDGGKKVKTLLEKPSVLELIDAFSSRLRSVCTLFGEYTTADDQDRYEQIKAHIKAHPGEISVESDLRPLIWDRDAEARGQKHKLKGVLGEIRLEGEIGPLVDYLFLAQYAHVGRQAAFGLGRFHVTFGSSGGGDPRLHPAGSEA